MNENHDPRLPRHFAAYGCMPAVNMRMESIVINIKSVPQRKTFGWQGAPAANQNRRGRRLSAVKD